MKEIAQTNGCEDPQECAKKFFNKVGNKLDITGFTNRAADETFVDFEDGAVQRKQQKDKPVTGETDNKVETSANEKVPELTDEQIQELIKQFQEHVPKVKTISEEKLKELIEKLKKEYPDLFKPNDTKPPTTSKIMEEI